MRWLCLVALLAVALAAAAAVGYAGSAPLPGHKGEDEIGYYLSRATPLAPGAVIERDVPLQGDGLSAIEFPYQSIGGAAEIRLTLTDAAGRAVQDRLTDLAQTPDPDGALIYWSVNYWGALAHYERIAVSVPAGTAALHLRLQVETVAGQLLVYLNALDSDGRPVAFPDTGSPVSARLAVRTLYGPVQPAVAAWRDTARRMSETGPPWLPYPAPVLLALALLVLSAAAVAAMVRADRS